MKVCNCRDFDCAATKKAIADNTPDHPEQVHEIIKDVPPECGACLPRIQAMMDEFNKTGKVPEPMDVDCTSIKNAREKLAQRFHDDVNDGDDTPYKTRFARCRASNTPD